MKDKKPPIVCCYLIPEIKHRRQNSESKGANFAFWCYYCHCWHLHGKIGYHLAFCKNKKSPYNDSGYILKSIGFIPPQYLDKCNILLNKGIVTPRKKVDCHGKS